MSKNLRNGQALIVLGMHRSGTSALTGALGLLGVQLGKRLFKPQPGVNEKGFFEHGDIADTDDDILLELGSRWDDILPLPPNWWTRPSLQPHKTKLIRYIDRDFSRAALWGLKDPRICRLLPFWQRILDEQGIPYVCLLALRNPYEVARSLERRDGFSREKALLLWLEHNLQAERHSRGQRRAFIAYDDLLERHEEELHRIARDLGIDFPVPLAQAAPKLREFLTPDMRHHQSPGQEGDTLLDRLAQQLFDALLSASRAEGALDVASVEAVAAAFAAFRAGSPRVLLDQLRLEMQERAALRKLFNSYYRSWWWVISRPLRGVERLLRQGRL